jgi:hypothetical protein
MAMDLMCCCVLFIMAPLMFFVAHRPKKPWIKEKELGCLQIYWTGFPETGNLLLKISATRACFV